MTALPNEFTALLVAGDADARALLGVAVDVLRRGGELARGVMAVISPVSGGYELDLGGASAVVTATASVARADVPGIAAGDVLRAGDGARYTVERVVALPADPSYRLDLSQ